MQIEEGDQRMRLKMWTAYHWDSLNKPLVR
jgi:hypothetical protein